jgi:hypothetical protein
MKTLEGLTENLYNYNIVVLKNAIAGIIRDNVRSGCWQWLEEKAIAISLEQTVATQLNLSFVSAPRKTGKAVLKTTKEQEQQIQSIYPHFTVQGWSVDRLSRVWLLLHIDATDKAQYIRVIENLFRSAEMNELVALYSALPLLAYPEAWRQRCAEGIRSNIGDVLEAIMCNNPYPARQLDEAAWNQLVLKAFFTDKSIHQIVGLDERTNQELANSLSDLAHERWAARRPVNPQLWRCVAPYLNEHIFPDIVRISNSVNDMEKKAAALACITTNYPAAKELLEKSPHLKSFMNEELCWEALQ